MRKAMLGAGIGLGLALACGALLLGSTQRTVVGTDEASQPVPLTPAGASDGAPSQEPQNNRGPTAVFDDDTPRTSPVPPLPSRVLPARPPDEEPQLPGAPLAQGQVLRAPSKALPVALPAE